MTLDRLIVSIGAAVILCALSIEATIVGFDGLGGTNSAVPSGLASGASADGSGFTVTNGTTPNIALTWDGRWDIYIHSLFNAIEYHTDGGAPWDNDGSGNGTIAQLDIGSHWISFAVDEGYCLILNSFDFGHTTETAGTTEWDLTLKDSGDNTVWSESVVLDNSKPDKVRTISPDFTGINGEDYTLTLVKTSETYSSNGRHAIDNLNFNQKKYYPPSLVIIIR